MGGLKDDWSRVAQLRQEEHTPPAPAADPAPKLPVPAETRQEAPEMSRRSWYAERGAVDALAAAVDDIHFATRAPKHEIVSALFHAAAAAAPKVRKKFSHE